MSAYQPRKPAGVPTGGQWAPVAHAEADISLDAGKPCRKCGTLTKRGSGLCRRCDPAKSERKERSARRSAYRNETGRSIELHDIRQCAYQFVPMYRSGETTDQFRQCANAVVAPATLCHRHGGAKEMSLGRSYAKAKAEATRGECLPLSDDYWEQTDARLEIAEGELSAILSTSHGRLAQALVTVRRQARKDSVARMSLGNQMLILVQHYSQAKREGMSNEDAWERASTLSSEPHLTASAWARAGRKPTDGGAGVAAIWYKPYTPKQGAEEDEDSDAGGGAGGTGADDRPPKQARTHWAVGGVIEYPLSATEGEPYEVAEDPLGTYHPDGDGDPEVAISEMERAATAMGVKVSYVDRKPGAAYAYWRADTAEIVVWSGIADGDRKAIAHSLAHELGHARLGHGTEDAADLGRPDKEAAAESFAALVCARAGISTSEMSALYISDWRKAQGVEAPRTSAVFRSALQAYDEYVTEVEGQ
jgi:hypothetical protein